MFVFHRTYEFYGIHSPVAGLMKRPNRDDIANDRRESVASFHAVQRIF